MEFPFSACIPDGSPGSKCNGAAWGWQLWLNGITKSVLQGAQIHLFSQAIGLIPQTAVKIIILPFLCDYSTCGIKLLANTVCWSTGLPPAPMKRMIIWMYLIPPAWLSVQSSFPLEETREDNRHRGSSLMSNCLEKKHRRMENNYGHLLFLKKPIQLSFSKRLRNWMSYASFLPKEAAALFSQYPPRSMGRRFGSWDHPCASAGPGSACFWPGKGRRSNHQHQPLPATPVPALQQPKGAAEISYSCLSYTHSGVG